MIDYKKMQTDIDSIPLSITHDLQRNLSSSFDKCGIFYRIFARCKSGLSTVRKFETKKYEESGKKMQDLMGARIVLYFKDDIDVCVSIIKKNYKIIDIVRDEEKCETFSPRRLNIICEMPNEIKYNFSDEIWDYPIDNTFEIQIRTIFSEGWHEVEHDLRYKNQNDWINHNELSRNLNGIFATLETCDWAILNVTDTLAYQKYKDGDWEAMLRNHLRIRMDNSPLNEKIKQIFDDNHTLAKEFYKIDRQFLLLCLSDENILSYPKKMDNYVFIINELLVKNDQISDLTPEIMRKNLKKLNIAPGTSSNK